MTQEEIRLQESQERKKHWKRWGPYLSERAWGTVREDYSPYGNAWEYLPHDHARSRAYRWNEDGLAGISDRHQLICFALGLWNERDPILKERLFGLTGNEGNHGEDVKEYYFYLDSTPTHSYMQFLYKYPQRAFPYASLVDENGRRRGEANSFEYELLDTGVFDSNRYFDVFVTYAKVDSDDILIRLEIVNRGPDAATLDVLPTLWFRNNWSWDPKNQTKPTIVVERTAGTMKVLRAESSDGQEFGDSLGKRWLYCDDGELLFAENETNFERFGWGPNTSSFVKDSINDFVVSRGARGQCNPALTGTKVAVRQTLTIAAGQSRVIRLRLSADANVADPFGAAFETTVAQRKAEADSFYRELLPAGLSADLQAIHRQAYAGMLWCKQ
ncbi:MAG TPA: glucosidase, partial [Terriglobales bacterium]|nr:glucosidase [Terriglobales bacterium]